MTVSGLEFSSVRVRITALVRLRARVRVRSRVKARVKVRIGHQSSVGRALLAQSVIYLGPRCTCE